MGLIKHYDKNKNGSDYIIGDLHGCYHLLVKLMHDADFDKRVDRIFSVGDLVDRGPESKRCAELITEPWFHSVRGNHEQMCIDVVRGNIDRSISILNGGQWFSDLEEIEQLAFAELFDSLPYAIEIESNQGLIGIVHADWPFPVWGDYSFLEFQKEKMIWSRDRVKSRNTFPVSDIFKIYCGHTVVSQPYSLGNVSYIDTGAVFGKTLTVISISGNDEIIS